MFLVRILFLLFITDSTLSNFESKGMVLFLLYHLFMTREGKASRTHSFCCKCQRNATLGKNNLKIFLILPWWIRILRSTRLHEIADRLLTCFAEITIREAIFNCKFKFSDEYWCWEIQGQSWIKSYDILLIFRDPPAITDQTLMSFSSTDNCFSLVRFRLSYKIILICTSNL